MKRWIFLILPLILLAFYGILYDWKGIPLLESNKNVVEQKGAHMQKEDQAPEYLYRIASTEQWEKSLAQHHVANSSIDKDFIHLSTEEQLPQVAQKFWKNQDYVILKLDSKKLPGRLVYETNPGGTTRYYHLYEADVPIEAVVEASMVRADKHK